MENQKPLTLEQRNETRVLALELLNMIPELDDNDALFREHFGHLWLYAKPGRRRHACGECAALWQEAETRVRAHQTHQPLVPMSSEVSFTTSYLEDDTWTTHCGVLGRSFRGATPVDSLREAVKAVYASLDLCPDDGEEF